MRKVSFLKSAVNPIDYPDSARPEIALAGRSNAGKSSLLNALTGKKVAHVSGSPGKTRLLNFFDVGDFYRIVDLPGYGYAARDHAERNQWRQMVETFLTKRDNLMGFILVCDVRRDWSDDEQVLLDFATHRGLKVLCVLTKSDKFSPAVLRREVARWQKNGPQIDDFFLPVSALKGKGVVELEDRLFKSWIQPLVKAPRS